ncbi:KRAB-A domain-containing protein 2-like [Portunus trituberculatus]|uniref:KRAB-A domain-containing protein 2-like n=1 Tax=Portunus trituberculatus TaxID=210409 RepID=UPI001E1D0455|nr:KRAB-A domain-containing protein 2-like [Portunus trituberculatus]
MLNELSKKYSNLTTWAVETYKSFCLVCQRKAKKQVATGVVVKPIDHLNKFCVRRAISSKRAVEVAYHLIDILLLLGALVIFQSDNGSEFTAHVITELKICGYPSRFVHIGRAMHSQSQESVES